MEKGEKLIDIPILEKERGLQDRSISPEKRSTTGAPDLARDTRIPLRASNPESESKTKASPNPGKYHGLRPIQVNIAGVWHTWNFHIIEAKKGTWLSAATRKFGWGDVYGPEDGYGAYVKGVVRREDGSFIFGKAADQIEPGELFAIKPYTGKPISAGKKGRKLGPAEKKRLVELLAKEHNLVGEQLKILAKAIDIIGKTGDVATVAEIVGLIGESGIIAGAATVVSLVGTVLLPFGLHVAVFNKTKTSERMYNLRAIAYTITAFAFDQDIPTGSRMTRRRWGGLVAKPEAKAHEKVWLESIEPTLRLIKQTALEKNVSIASYKAFLRALGSDDEQKLCRMILSGFEGKLKDLNLSVLNTYKSNIINIPYPN